MKIVILNILAFSSCISVIILVILGIMTFPQSILPEIERKVGQKIDFSKIPIYGPYKTPIYAGHVSWYIFAKTILYKLGKDANKIKIKEKYGCLQAINYPVEMFSRKEIIWSFAIYISGMIAFTAAIVVCFLSGAW